MWTDLYYPISEKILVTCTKTSQTQQILLTFINMLVMYTKIHVTPRLLPISTKLLLTYYTKITHITDNNKTVSYKNKMN